MKTKSFSKLLTLCLAVGLTAIMSCCEEDSYIDFIEGDMTHFEENGIKGIIFNYSINGSELTEDNNSQFEYREDRPIGACFLVRYVEKSDLRNHLDGGDVIADKGFMAIYNESGKLVHSINFRKIQCVSLLVGVLGYPDAQTLEYHYVWTDINDRPILRPGKYVSQFTIQYNSTPGTAKKEMKKLTFRKSFEIVRQE